MDISLINYDNIAKIYGQKGYKFYTDPFDLNITGIRNANPILNAYGCHFAYSFIDDKGVGQTKIVSGTTLPGKFWLNNPENPGGTAIVKEGYYHSLWQIGLHFGYKALVQINNVTVYRDSNHDNNFDLVLGTETEGVFGINHHHAWADGISQAVDKWSAGCQVVWLINDWNNTTLNMIDNQVKAGKGDKFSYGLINEKDFINLK